MDEEQYIDYFRKLAGSHSAIRHSDTEVHFYAAADNSLAEVSSVMRNINLPALILDPYDDELDRSQDNFRQRPGGGFSIVMACDGNDPDDVRQARRQARQIGLDMLNRMVSDSRTIGHFLKQNGVVFELRFKGTPVESLGDALTGWGYDITWQQPTKVAVDTQVWDDLP